MRTLSIVLGMGLALSACNKGGGGDAKDGKDAKADAKSGKDGKDAKADAKAEGGDDGLKVAEFEEGPEGPVPPDTSMVFFSIEGAVQPLACFDKDKKKLDSGKTCLDMVPKGAEVRLKSADIGANKPVGEPTEAQCTAGGGKKTALAVEGITEGGNWLFAAWPPSTQKIVSTVPEDTTSPAKTRLSDEEKAKLAAAIKKAGGPDGTVSANQVAEIDQDKDGKPDKFYGVLIEGDPGAESYRWSGAFLAPAGELDKAMLVETSRTKKDVFEVRAVLDIDGDGHNELWLRLRNEEGGGDRIVDIAAGKATPVGDWTCGVG
jgi:hypothetical protein